MQPRAPPGLLEGTTAQGNSKILSQLLFSAEEAEVTRGHNLSLLQASSPGELAGERGLFAFSVLTPISLLPYQGRSFGAGDGGGLGAPGFMSIPTIWALSTTVEGIKGG